MTLYTLQMIRGTYHTTGESSHEETFEYTYYRWSCRHDRNHKLDSSSPSNQPFKLHSKSCRKHKLEKLVRVKHHVIFRAELWLWQSL